MEKINLQAKAKEFVSNASRTEVTITEEELMAAVKILSEPIIQDIKAQKKTMFCKKDELVALATQHITKNIDKDKYSCDYTLLSTCHIMLHKFLWDTVNKAEGEYIQNKLMENDLQFAEDFFYDNNPSKVNIARLRIRLIREISSSYGVSITHDEVSTIIYSHLWDGGAWNKLKNFKKDGSIYSWIETQARHEIIRQLQVQHRIPMVRKRTVGNTRISMRKLTKDRMGYILDNEALPKASYHIVKNLYFDKKSPKEIMKRNHWDETTYKKQEKKAMFDLKDTLLRSAENYDDVLKDKLTRNEPVSLDEAQENGNQMSYENQVPIMEEVFGLGLTQDEVDDKALEALHFIAGKMECSKRDRYIWECRFYENESPEKLAKELGMKRTNVDNIYSRVNKEFKKAAKEWYCKVNRIKQPLLAKAV